MKTPKGKVDRTRTRAGTGPKGGQKLRIRVTDVATGRTKASIQIPLGLVDTAVRLGARFVPPASGVDTSDVLAAVEAGLTGKIIDVISEEEGEHVEIFVE